MTTFYYTTAQQSALTVVPKITSALSFVGSALIVCDLFHRKHRRKQKQNTRHRLLLFMSIFDMVSSAAWFLGAWMQPKELGIDGSVGNWGTCEMQGFLIQFALGAIAYNASLAMYYYLMIARNWSNEKITKRVEPLFHLLACLLVLVTGIAGLVLKLFNPLYTNCWIAAYPVRCTQSYERLGFTNCTRGDNAFIFAWSFYAPLWIASVVSTACMALVFWHIRQVERAVASRVVQRSHSRSKTRQFARQAMLYLGAFYLTWGFVSVQRILSLLLGKFWWGLSFTAAVFVPMQGFFNAIIYFVPKREHRSRQRRNSAPIIMDPYAIVASLRPGTGAADIPSPDGSGRASEDLSTHDDLHVNGPLDPSPTAAMQGTDATSEDIAPERVSGTWVPGTTECRDSTDNGSHTEPILSSEFESAAL